MSDILVLEPEKKTINAVTELILIEDDSNLGNEITELIREAFSNESLKLTSLTSYEKFSSWLLSIDSMELSERTILLCDFNLQNWEKQMNSSSGEQIDDGSEVIHMFSERYEDNIDIINIIYSKQVKHTNFIDIVEENLPEDTLLLPKNFDETDALIHLLINLLEKKMSPREIKKYANTHLIPANMRFLYNRVEDFQKPTVLTGLFKEMFQNPLDFEGLTQMGNMACELINLRNPSEKIERVIYDDLVLDVNFLVDNSPEKNGKQEIKGIRINRFNVTLHTKEEHFVDKIKVNEVWGSANIYERALISVFYPKIITDYIDTKVKGRISEWQKIYTKRLSSFDVPFKLQLILELTKLLKTNGYITRDILDQYSEWAEIIGLKMVDILELNVANNFYDDQVIECAGDSILPNSEPIQKYIPTRILKDFGCLEENSKFLLFIYDNGTGVETYAIEPVI